MKFLDLVSRSDGSNEETCLRLFSHDLILRANGPLRFLLQSFSEGGML